MILESVHISREGNLYGASNVDASKPFRASIKVAGIYGKVELLLSPEMSKRIVEIVADEVAKAGRATAEMMTAQAFDTKALKAPAAA